jgi:hypothetical protein
MAFHMVLELEQVFRTIDIERRGYGRRYTSLPVDSLSRTEFVIDFTGAYMKPEMIDIRRNDTVRWREGERLIQGQIADVQREEFFLRALVEDAQPLPPESFFP